MLHHHLLPLLLACQCLGTAWAADFERLSYDMPMRCDVGLALDADADGDLDLIGICRTKLMAVRLPEGEVVELVDTGSGGMIHGLAADMDGDGERAVVVCRFKNVWQQYHVAIAEGKDWDEPAGPDFTIGWFENPGSLDAEWALHVVDREVNGTHGIAAGDLDGDGRSDLVAANVMGAHPKSVTWYPTSSGERRFVQADNAGGRPHYVAVGDLDGDGRSDVALGTGGGWSIHLQSADGWQHQTIGRAKGGTNVALGDVDVDGDLDVIGSAGHGSGVRWFANPEWSEHMIDAGLADVHSLAAGDLDGDGAVEVVANSNASKQTVVYRNDGSGGFAAQVIDEGNQQQSYGCVIVDVDDDGKDDVVLGGRNAKNLVWYRQR